MLQGHRGSRVATFARLGLGLPPLGQRTARGTMLTWSCRSPTHPDSQTSAAVRAGRYGGTMADWISIATLAAGGGLTQVGAWLQRRWSKNDKREERLLARSDGHRDSLREAYVAFITTYSSFIDAGGLMISMSIAIEEQRQEAHEAAINAGADAIQAAHVRLSAANPDLIERSRKQVDEFTSKSTQADTMAIRLMLLEDRPELHAQILALSNANLQPPQGPSDYERFRNDLKRVRGLLDALARSQAGAFAPNNWEHRNRQLEAGGRSGGQLEAGGRNGGQLSAASSEKG
jgi:hypothetical protein